MARSAIVLGSTGLVGSRCVHHLLASPAYDSLTCFVRRAGSASTTSKVREVVVDFDNLKDDDIAKADIAEDLFCAVGTTMKKAGSQEAFRKIDYDLPFNFISRAATKLPSLKRIGLVSSVGADSSSGTFYLKTKGELEDALAKLPSIQAFHILRPSFLVGERSESRTGENIGIAIAKATSGLLLGGLRKYRPISVDDVGKALVGAMQQPDEGRKVYEFDAILKLGQSL